MTTPTASCLERDRMKKVVLIGDSIRQGYEKYVRLALDGVAEDRKSVV